MFSQLEGLVAAVHTPMHADGSLNHAAVAPLAQLLVRNGVAGVFVGGTTGEGLSLTTQERMTLAQGWVDVAGRDLAVVVHVGHAALAESKALAAHAGKIHAAAVGMMAPCFFRPRTLEDLIDSCAFVAAAAPGTAFYYYHIPSLAGCPFLMADFLASAHASGKIPNLAGMKYTWEDLMDYRLCVQFEGGRYDMLFGRDEILLLGLACGARGGIGGTYTACATVYNRLIAAYRAGDMPTAEAMQDLSVRYVQAIRRTGRELIAVKTTMKFLGVDLGPARLPVPNFTAADERAFRAELEAIGFFEWGNK